MTHNELPCEDYCTDIPEGFEIVEGGTLPGPVQIIGSGPGRFFEGATPVKVKLKYLIANNACEYCDSTQDVTWDADPYAADILNDSTPHYICANCQHERAMDI